ncbi:MAG: HD domain-containing protein [Candidatus Omnitrophica bacterium]|nr:HD domain-containing protein [Candidatus Omnitrophota bacterium]
MAKRFISEFKVNERVDSFFILRKKNLKLTKHDKPYLELTLTDKTGKIEARMWDDAEKFSELIETGNVVHVKGTIDKYKEEKQLKVDYIAPADDRDFVYEDLVRVLENAEEVFEKLIAHLKGIKNKWIKTLAKEFYEDEKLMQLFKNGLGGKAWHNAYIGGLLEHTYEVTYISDLMCKLYPEADKDVVILGAFLHDIGKVYELDPKKMEYTIEGGLVGHIGIGHKILMEKTKNIDNFPPDLCLRLEHIVLSHHGKYEQQSPVLPKTLEATIIYHADELASQTNAIKEIQLQQQEEGKVWSDFVSIKNRKYFIKEAESEEWAMETEKNEKPGPRDKGTKELFDF